LGSGTFRVSVIAEEGAQALAILGTCRAALKVRPHARKCGVGIGSGELQFDVAVQLLEALLTAGLRVGRPNDASHQTIRIARPDSAHLPSRSSFPPRLMLRVDRLALSFWRASWSVL
jgi:hypothetical protein